MSESDDSDILADIKALDNALLLDSANDKANSSWHDLHDDSSSSSIDESDNESYNDDQFYNQLCQDTETINAYEINKKLTKGLMLVKKKVSVMLQRCEEKIEELSEEIETNKDGNMLQVRTRYSIAGTPYFKDKAGFGAAKNADTRLKESRDELSVLQMQKSCRWSGTDRTMLLNAIYDEVLNSISISGSNVEINELSDERTNNQTGDTATNGVPSKSDSIMNNSALRTVTPINFTEIVRTMSEKQIDWMKIAAQHFSNKHSLGECRSMWNVYLHPDINKGDWTNTEDQKLVKLAKKGGYQDWDTITKKLDTKRSAYQCFIRYNTIQNLPVAGRAWTKLEDEHLQLVLSKLQIGNYIPWAEVAIYMGNRTKQQVYTRWMYRTAPHLTKGRFNYMETKTLLEAIKQYGTNFSKISRYVMPHRTTVQLNNHYQSIHQSKVNKWTHEDDVKLLKLHKKHGNDWVKIAKSFTLKTRTQVRHRHMALQKYINKGYKIMTIPRSNQSTSLGSRKTGASLLAQNSKSTCQKISLLNCVVSNDTIQERLFENLNFPLMSGSTEGSQEIYDLKQLAHNTKELYEILKLLDVKFDVPNMFLDYAHLSKKERQLFASLKKYVNVCQPVSNEKHNEIIERFRLQMFGSETQSVISHFIPPLPFNGYVKRKRKYKTNSINYDLDYSEKFLVDVSDRIIPCYSNCYFVDVDEEIQFQKLSQLLINDNYSCNRQNINSLASLGYNSSFNEIKNQTPLRSKSNTAIEIERHATKTVQSCKTQKATYAEHINKDIEEMEMLDAITPSQETLLGLKNLIFWKMLYEYENNQSYSKSKNIMQQPNSTEYEKAYQTLKTRLMRLFKLPLALSRVMVELPEQEALFIMEEQKEQSKQKWSEKETEKNKQTIFANNSFMQKTTW
ncbi:snRNA-activating protein complex subunit 4 [Odontomachus brunneus]|uniref:snRNA-activating protein complex subunit 4 n=1 Tax=Odontomachus brunneus TaxID=486640 RepID=UPI0013F191C9|nr:snRNA-activating protein complex subunit 4 [Odontomachus brunneus]XP_032666178.1 snRNA-activating protein complex subunit 4 [Odontomachus brunneus]XP_032666179.1 snRNA-activating protein complex subunit 4 [Odontomachus brunneus]XP_032666180.1 snRNA-activating protein complex subunit 4 [Odontomachus brunneus]